jgi:hypothetical protein
MVGCPLSVVSCTRQAPDLQLTDNGAQSPNCVKMGKDFLAMPSISISTQITHIYRIET